VNDKTSCNPYIEVSLDNLLDNLAEIRRTAPSGKGIMAVVKDLAYGCGSVMVSSALQQSGVAWLAVATAGEARVLRDNGVTLPVLILGPCSAEEISWGNQNNVSFSCNDPLDLGPGNESGAPVKFHLNIDTGMGRLGVRPEQISQVIPLLTANRKLICEGAYTHLACADRPDTDTVALQLKRFRGALDLLHQNGISPKLIHYANSAAIMRFPVSPECTLVRPGIALYGCKPDPAQDFPLHLKSVISLKAKVAKIKRVPKGTCVSYGGRYVTSSETCIATIPLGYGIGLPRLLSNKGQVLIKGKRYTIAGTVTMDFIMVDAGAKPDFSIGDEVVAIGYQDGEYISPDDVALHAQTIGYEILCGLSTKLDRYYLRGNAVIRHQPGFYF